MLSSDGILLGPVERSIPKAVPSCWRAQFARALLLFARRCDTAASALMSLRSVCDVSRAKPASSRPVRFGSMPGEGSHSRRLQITVQWKLISTSQHGDTDEWHCDVLPTPDLAGKRAFASAEPAQRARMAATDAIMGSHVTSTSCDNVSQASFAAVKCPY